MSYKVTIESQDDEDYSSVTKSCDEPAIALAGAIAGDGLPRPEQVLAETLLNLRDWDEFSGYGNPEWQELLKEFFAAASRMVEYWDVHDRKLNSN